MTQFFSDNSLSRKNLHLNKPEFVDTLCDFIRIVF